MATSPVNFSMLDPSMAADQMALERNMALAQALRQQSMTPIDTNGRMAGAVMSRVSPFEGLAKMLQGYNAGKWNEQNDADRMALAQKQSALIGALIGGQTNPQAASTAALGAGAAQGDVGPTVTNGARMDQSVAGQGAGGIPSLTGDPNRDRALAMTMGLDEYAKVAAKRYEPTEATRQAIAAGQDPRAVNAAAIAKNNMLPVKPNEPVYDMSSGAPRLSVVAPNAAENLQYNVGPNGAVSASGVPGVPVARAEASGATAGATAAAQAPHQIIEVYDPGTQRMVKVFAGNALSPVSPPPPATTPPKGSAATVAGMRTLAGEPNDPLAIDREIAATTRDLSRVTEPSGRAQLEAHLAELKQQKVSSSGAPSAPSLGEADQMKSMTERFAALRGQNSEAQNTISYLQGIKQQSTKAATGQFSDRLQFVNSLLSPFSEKAMDAATATQLLNKYSNQIVARLGQGGLGTDAARSILQSAYPNAHMTPGAIHEAADNLIGAQNMLMAKTSLLAPLHNSRNAAAYQTTEQKFDQLADPRIWQLKAMDEPQAKAFLSKMPPKEQASLRERAVELQKMGAL